MNTSRRVANVMPVSVVQTSDARGFSTSYRLMPSNPKRSAERASRISSTKLKPAWWTRTQKRVTSPAIMGRAWSDRQTLAYSWTTSDHHVHLQQSAGAGLARACQPHRRPRAFVRGGGFRPLRRERLAVHVRLHRDDDRVLAGHAYARDPVPGHRPVRTTSDSHRRR